jgi:hypothetical protein
MRQLLIGVSLVGLISTPALAQSPSTTRTLALTFEADGSVSLKAQNVTSREVLAEWARQCGCTIVNAQNLTGAPVTVPVEFSHARQAAVLASLLRQAAGYTLTPRREGSRSASEFETIYIVATSNATQTAYTPPPSMPTPVDDEIPPVVPTILRADPGNQQPAGGAQPQPQQPASNQPAAPRGPGAGGVFVPIVPIGGSSQPASTPAPGSVTPAPARPAGR